MSSALRTSSNQKLLLEQSANATNLVRRRSCRTAMMALFVIAIVTSCWLSVDIHGSSTTRALVCCAARSHSRCYYTYPPSKTLKFTSFIITGNNNDTFVMCANIDSMIVFSPTHAVEHPPPSNVVTDMIIIVIIALVVANHSIAYLNVRKMLASLMGSTIRTIRTTTRAAFEQQRHCENLPVNPPICAANGVPDQQQQCRFGPAKLVVSCVLNMRECSQATKNIALTKFPQSCSADFYARVSSKLTSRHCDSFLVIVCRWMFAVFTIYAASPFFPLRYAAYANDVSFHIPGDIILGGVFPVHEQGNEAECGKNLSFYRGLQRVEAMMYAIHKVNQDPDLLGDLRLGAHIVDSCSSDMHALRQSLAFVRNHFVALEKESDFICGDYSAPQRRHDDPNVVGVVGGHYSSVSIQVANLLRIFATPQISPASTSTKLSDRKRYEYFARVVPPDDLQARAMVGICRYFNWSYVSTVASETEYGQTGIDMFKRIAAEYGICVAKEEKVKSSSTEEDIQNIIRSLMDVQKKARVVIVFCRKDDAKRLFDAARNMTLAMDNFVWIASEAMGVEEYIVEQNKAVAEGVMVLDLESAPVGGFSEWFLSLHPAKPRADFPFVQNPWIVEYFQDTFGCRMPPNATSQINEFGITAAADTGGSNSASLSRQVSAHDNTFSPAGLNHVYSYHGFDYYGDPSNAASSSYTSAGESTNFQNPQPSSDDVVGSQPQPQPSLPQKQQKVRYCDPQKHYIKRDGFSQDSKLQYVVDSVYAFANAISRYLKDKCPNSSDSRRRLRRDYFCDKLHNINGTELYQYIINVDMKDPDGNDVRFDSNGDGFGRYRIMNYQCSDGEVDELTGERIGQNCSYRKIGGWVMESGGDATLEFDEIQMVWPNINGRRIQNAPSSTCSEPCDLRYQVKIQEPGSCCFYCRSCTKKEIIANGTCIDCAPTYWPTPDKRACLKILSEYVEWQSLYGVVPIAVAAVGIILTSYTIITFMQNHDTPIVKASGRELSYLLLFGILFCFLMTFVLLVRPSLIACAAQRFGIGFGFSIMYGALLTKTNRIARIFEAAKRTAKRPSLISPKSQLLIALCLVSVQVFSTLIWLVVMPPGTREDVISQEGDRQDVVLLKCQIDDRALLVSLAYVMILILTCTVYAVKTRKIPENFNESKFIGFTMYTTCIIWLAFVPIYFGTYQNFHVQLTTLCVSISLSASVTLFCLFFPKLYIIVFHPEKNRKMLTMNKYKKTPTTATSSMPATVGTSNMPTSNHVEIRQPPPMSTAQPTNATTTTTGGTIYRNPAVAMTNNLVSSSAASYDIDSAISGSESHSQNQALLPQQHQHGGGTAGAAHRLSHSSDVRSPGLNSGLGGAHSIMSPTAAALPPLRKPSIVSSVGGAAANSITNRFSSIKGQPSSHSLLPRNSLVNAILPRGPTATSDSPILSLSNNKANSTLRKPSLLLDSGGIASVTTPLLLPVASSSIPEVAMTNNNFSTSSSTGTPKADSPSGASYTLLRQPQSFVATAGNVTMTALPMLNQKPASNSMVTSSTSPTAAATNNNSNNSSSNNNSNSMNMITMV